MLTRFLLSVSALSLALLASAQEAIQHRIALLPEGMTVSWSTIGELSQVPTVSYGVDRNAMNNAAKGDSAHYDASVTHFHHVELNGLQPSTRYYWQVTSPANQSSPILSFMTAPKAGDKRPMRFAMNGDLGIGNSDDTVRRMKQLAPSLDLFWHIGDLSYADDWKSTPYTYEQIQEAWMNNMTDVWNETPYMFLPGNHETSCSESDEKLCTPGQLNFSSYRERFRMPFKQSGGPNNMFYSFDYGLVHFISMDSEVDFPNSPEGPGTKLNAGPFGDQHAWLEADLKKANANRENVPFIFAGCHRPWYASAAGGDWKPMVPFFEPLMLKYEVDVIVTGHIHYTERMYPIGANGVVSQRDYINPRDPVYFVTASVGNIEGLTQSKPNDTISAYLDTKHFGISIMTVLNETTLHFVYQESKSGEVLDQVIITKEKRKNRFYDEEDKPVEIPELKDLYHSE